MPVKTVSSDGPVRQLMEGLSRSGPGADYFRALVREMTSTLGVEYAFVAELISHDPLRARTLAVRADGIDLPNGEFDLSVSPCRELLDAHYVCYPEGARLCFPDDLLFVEWSVESYAGARLLDGDGDLLGWFAVLSRLPIEDTAAVRSALCFLSERTAAELQRERAERDLRQAYADLEGRVAERTAELERANAVLRETQERYELAARGSNDGLWDWDLVTGSIHVSARGKAIVGCEHEGLACAREFYAHVHPDDRARVEEEIERHLRGETDAFESEYRVGKPTWTAGVLAGDAAQAPTGTSALHVLPDDDAQAPTGTPALHDSSRWVLCRGAVTRDGNGRSTRFAGSLTDITRRKRNEAQLVFDATHDHLTGLPNRVSFCDRVNHAIAINRRTPVYDFAVLFLDIDRFKVTNDSLGHTAGDELLVQVAKRLRQSVRPSDTVARLGGDEFTVLVENISGPHDAVQVAERIQAGLARPMTAGGYEIFTCASIGIAISTPSYAAAEEIIRDADTAMYRAKRKGAGRYEIFDAKMHVEAVQRLETEIDLRRAVEREEFRVVYHPIVAIPSRALTGFEALLRWEHPTRGLVMPSDFIALAEETDLILPIGGWVIDHVAGQLLEWNAPGVNVSVNLSPRQLRDPHLICRLEEALHVHGVSNGRLSLEITESALMEHPEAALEVLRQIQSIGIGLSIDDFGTGYSSLAYLVNLPATSVKIDRSFIHNLESGSESEEIVRMIIALGHSLGLKVIAEGVETEAQLQRLTALGCDAAQGFLFGRPLAAHGAARRLRG